MGYTIKQANYFEEKNDPADAFLMHWAKQNGNDVPNLITILGSIYIPCHFCLDVKSSADSSSSSKSKDPANQV